MFSSTPLLSPDDMALRRDLAFPTEPKGWLLIAASGKQKPEPPAAGLRFILAGRDRRDMSRTMQSVNCSIYTMFSCRHYNQQLMRLQTGLLYIGLGSA